MRRKDREITNPAKIKAIIAACHCCRLGLNDQGKVYIVPLSFGYTEENGKLTFYFHSASSGRKIDLLTRNPYAGFQLDTNYNLNPGDTPCTYSARFQSIIGEGIISFISDPQQKQEALQAIMQHTTKEDNWSFTPKMVQGVCVFKLEVTQIACKEHL